MKKIVAHLLTVALVIIGLSSCESWMRNPLQDKESGEDIKLLVVDFNFIKTKLAVHLKDITDNTYIEGSEVEVKFVGEDAGNLISFTGIRKQNYVTSSGYIEIGVDPNILISEENPLNISVVVIGDRYVSAPMALSYTTTGLKDVLVKVTRIGGKSGSTGAFSEPFDLYYDNVLHSDDLLYLGDIRGSSTGTDYDYLNLYQTRTARNLEAKNLTDPILYTDYGVYYAWADDILSPPEAPVKQVSLNSGALVYSSVLRSGMSKCAQGLTLKINSASAGGSGSFGYLLTFSDGTTRDGIVSGTFPIEVKIDNIYYPASGSAVTVALFDDAQYTVSGSVDLGTPCGSVAEFTATAKSNLKTYKWIIRYSCPDVQASFALSIGGEFRIDGSDNAWTRFQFVEGIALLQLVQDEDYHFRINIDGEVYEYVLPTDPDKLEEFLQNNQTTDFYTIDNLTITETTSLVTVEADVTLAGEVCDVLN